MMQTFLVVAVVAGALWFLGAHAWQRAQARSAGHACPTCSLANGMESDAKTKVASSDARG